MNPISPANEAPIRSFRGRPVGKSRVPGDRDGKSATIDQVNGHRIVGDGDRNGLRRLAIFSSRST